MATIRGALRGDALYLVMGGAAATTKLRECPHCASNDLEVVEFEDPTALAVRCNECGSTEPMPNGAR